MKSSGGQAAKVQGASIAGGAGGAGGAGACGDSDGGGADAASERAVSVSVAESAASGASDSVAKGQAVAEAAGKSNTTVMHQSRWSTVASATKMLRQAEALKERLAKNKAKVGDLFHTCKHTAPRRWKPRSYTI